MIERLSPEIILGAESLGILALAFSRLLKELIKEQQNYKCDKCGKKTTLQVHHKVPQCLGGNNSPENAVALCPNCHLDADNNAILYGIVYPDILIEEVDGGLFENYSKLKKYSTLIDNRRFKR